MEEYIKGLARDYNIREIRFDPFQFHRSAQALRSEGLRLVEYPQTTDRLISMSQNLFDLIKDGNLVLYRDQEFRNHAQKATAKESQRGWRIVKKKSSHKIDLIISLAMSCQATVESPADSGQGIKFVLGGNREHQKVSDYQSPPMPGESNFRDLLDRKEGYTRVREGADRTVRETFIPDPDT